jgi:hypothetical protein
VKRFANVPPSSTVGQSPGNLFSMQGERWYRFPHFFSTGRSHHTCQAVLGHPKASFRDEM